MVGDGNLAVFIGGRARFGRYPEAADSMLILRDGQGHMTEAGAAAAGALMGLGLVSLRHFRRSERRWSAGFDRRL